MSTTFYLKKKIKPEIKTEIIDFILEDKYEEAINKIMNEHPVTSIGTRSGGWRFLWHAHKFKYYDPDVNSLINWLKSGKIFDEYRREYTYEEFIKELDGFLEEGKTNNDISYRTKSINEYKEFEEKYGILVDHVGEFYMHGKPLCNSFLRFTVEN